MRKLVAGIALVGLLGTAQPGQTQDYSPGCKPAPARCRSAHSAKAGRLDLQFAEVAAMLVSAPGIASIPTP